MCPEGLSGDITAGCEAPRAKSAEITTETWEKFEARLEYLRQQMKIPGLSAAVVMDQKLVWAKGFGYADLENRIEVNPDTPFPLASVTKTVAAVLIMQLVQERVISLDDPRFIYVFSKIASVLSGVRSVRYNERSRYLHQDASVGEDASLSAIVLFPQ